MNTSTNNTSTNTGPAGQPIYSAEAVKQILDYHLTEPKVRHLTEPKVRHLTEPKVRHLTEPKVRHLTNPERQPGFRSVEIYSRDGNTRIQLSTDGARYFVNAARSAAGSMLGVELQEIGSFTFGADGSYQGGSVQLFKPQHTTLKIPVEQDGFLPKPAYNIVAEIARIKPDRNLFDLAKEFFK